MKRIIFLVLICISSGAMAQADDWRAGAGPLMLADRLDRPDDGYCLDVPGSGDWVNFTVPLTAHNCKEGRFADESVVFDVSPGPIRFPAYDGCVTAVGIMGASLPGAAVMLRQCAFDPEARMDPFVDKALQIFEHREDGRIALAKTDLCLTAGPRSDRTFSAAHRWRPLSLAVCSTTDPTLSVWQRFSPDDKP